MLVLTILLATLVITMEALAQEVNLTASASGEKPQIVDPFVKNMLYHWKNTILLMYLMNKVIKSISVTISQIKLLVFKKESKFFISQLVHQMSKFHTWCQVIIRCGETSLNFETKNRKKANQFQNSTTNIIQSILLSFHAHLYITIGIK